MVPQGRNDMKGVIELPNGTMLSTYKHISRPLTSLTRSAAVKGTSNRS